MGRVTGHAGLTPLASAVLSLLCEGPKHPYDIYRTLLERHEDVIVKLRPGSLYHTVDRLAEAELLEVLGTERDGARPERTTYRITEAGRAALVGYVREGLAGIAEEYPRFPTALAHARNLEAGAVDAALRERLDAVQKRLTENEGMVAAAMAVTAEANLLDAHYLLAVWRAERDWLHELLRRLDEGELTWPSE